MNLIQQFHSVGREKTELLLLLSFCPQLKISFNVSLAAAGIFQISEQKLFFRQSIHRKTPLLHGLAEEVFHLVKWDYVRFVIKVCMDSIRNDHQFFVLCVWIIVHHICIGVSAEVAGVRLLPVDNQNGASSGTGSATPPPRA